MTQPAESPRPEALRDISNDKFFSSEAEPIQSKIDIKATELEGYINDLNSAIEAGNPIKLPRDHPFEFVESKELGEEAVRLLSEAVYELTLRHREDANQILSDFHDSLDVINAELDDALLKSFFRGPSNHPELRDTHLSLTEAVDDESSPAEEVPASGDVPTGEVGVVPAVTEPHLEAPTRLNALIDPPYHEVKSGDTMYGILTNMLGGDANAAVRNKVCEKFGISTDLSTRDIVLQLFSKTDGSLPNFKLRQNLIYPGDAVKIISDGNIQYFKNLDNVEQKPPARVIVDTGAIATEDHIGGDGYAQASEEKEEVEDDPDADQDDISPEPILDDSAEPAEEGEVMQPTDIADSAEASFIPTVDEEAAPEAPRLPQNLQDFLAAFPGLRIAPKDFVITSIPHPNDPKKNLVTVEVKRFAFRGKIQSVASGDLKVSIDSEGDDQTAKGKAISQLTTDFNDVYKTLTENSAEEHAASNQVPDDFGALGDFLKEPENNDIYDVKVIAAPQNPENVGTDPFRYNIHVMFEVDGYPGQVELRWPKNVDIQGKTIDEARTNAYAAVMRLLPAAVIETREKAAKHADERLAADNPTELLPVTPAEQYAYFRDSIKERSDGSVEFKFFHPVASLNSGKPCQGLLKPDGTLRLIGPTGLDVSFQVSYTARQNGTDVDQPFGQVRLIKTRSGSYGGGTEPRGYKDFMKEPLKPWVDKVADSKGNFVRADLVIGDGFLYDVVRDALAKPARQPDGTDRPDPETFLGQYRVSNDSSSAPRSAVLPSGTNYLWIKPIEKKL